MSSLILAQQPNTAALVGIWLFVAIMLMIEFAIIGVMLAGLWKVFEKAGEPGWAAIIPIYNGMVLMRIAGKPEWWVVFCFIPMVNAIIMIIATVDLAKNFGQTGGFTVGLIFLPFVFYPILGFGRAQYLGRSLPPQYGFPVGPSQPNTIHP